MKPELVMKKLPDENGYEVIEIWDENNKCLLDRWRLFTPLEIKSFYEDLRDCYDFHIPEPHYHLVK